jgi:probable F420-dependent oxidoreductase
MAIKVGVGFFVTAYTVDAVTLGKAAEDAGFDSFWVPDHTVLPTTSSVPYPGGGEVPRLYGEMADPFVLLSFIGAATKQIRLCTGICLVPERHPLTLAKTVGTLDNFSGGRVELGIGVGWHREETELYGTEFRTRWAYTRESVEAMKLLWEKGAASYSGKYVSFPEVRCDPMPVQRPYPPVIIGAQPTEKTFKRVARFGDGWLPVMCTAEQVAAARKAIEAECREIGRDPSGITISVFAMDVTPETQRRYEDAGADRLVIGIYNHPGTPLPHEQWGPVRLKALGSPAPSPGETMAVLEKMAQLAKL